MNNYHHQQPDLIKIRSYGADAQLGRLPQLAKDIAASSDAVVVLGWPPANATDSAAAFLMSHCRATT
jgi:hypothetical protein